MAPRKYRWADWFARGSFSLTEGVDYRCSTESAIQQARNWWRAKRGRAAHLKIVRSVSGFTVIVLKPEQDGRAWNRRPRKDAPADSDAC